MKKVFTSLFLVACLLLAPSLISAQGVQNRIQDPTTHISGAPTATSQGNKIQNQNQIATQNMGEETQLTVATQQMQMLMNMQGLDEEVGQAVKNVAQQQVAAQTQTQQQLSKLNQRSAFMKKLFGADQNAIKALNGQIEQNRLRITQLQKLQTQIQNQADATQLQNAIAALVTQNTALTQQVTAEQSVKGLFGWLVRLFNK